MIKIKQAIVVEGKYDKIKLSSIIDCVVIVTDGYGIFKNQEKMSIIRHYAKTTGVIILTDSDSAGFTIRNHLKGAIKEGSISHVYIPDIFGKERRKTQASKEGKLGVEGIDKNVILESFRKSGIIFFEDLDSINTKQSKKITKLHLFEDGLTGKLNSSDMRKKLLLKLELPQLLTTNSMLEILNSMLSIDDYNKIISELNGD